MIKKSFQISLFVVLGTCAGACSSSDSPNNIDEPKNVTLNLNLSKTDGLPTPESISTNAHDILKSIESYQDLLQRKKVLDGVIQKQILELEESSAEADQLYSNRQKARLSCGENREQVQEIEEEILGSLNKSTSENLINSDALDAHLKNQEKSLESRKSEFINNNKELENLISERLAIGHTKSCGQFRTKKIFKGESLIEIEKDIVILENWLANKSYSTYTDSLLADVKSSDIQNSLTSLIFGEPSKADKAKFLLKQLRASVKAPREELRSCESKNLAIFNALSEKKMAIKSLKASLLHEFIETHKDDFENLELMRAQIQAYKGLELSLKSCTKDEESSAASIAGNSRLQTHMFRVFDRLQVSMDSIDMQISKLESKADEIARLKEDVLINPASLKTYQNANKALILTHALQSGSEEELKLYKKLDSVTSDLKAKNLFSLKPEFEKAVAQNFWNGKDASYNRDFENFFDLITHNKIQCYSGTLNFINAYLKSYIKPEKLDHHLVAIFTAGHVLPGALTLKDKQWSLTGIETTATGRALIDYGPTQNIRGEIRVVSLLDFLLIELFKNELKDTGKSFLSTKKFLKDKGFAHDYLKSLDTSLSQSSTTQAVLNSSPLAFGKVSVPSGDLVRENLDSRSSASAYRLQKPQPKPKDVTLPAEILVQDGEYSVNFEEMFMAVSESPMGKYAVQELSGRWFFSLTNTFTDYQTTSSNFRPCKFDPSHGSELVITCETYANLELIITDSLEAENTCSVEQKRRFSEFITSERTTGSLAHFEKMVSEQFKKTVSYKLICNERDAQP